MKTTKSTVLAKKIETLRKDKSLSSSGHVANFINSILNGEKTFRPVIVYVGRGWKSSSIIDHTNLCEKELNKLNLKYSISNDAPRSGKTGVRIDILTKVLN